VVLAAIDTVFEGHAKHIAAILAACSELNWFAGHSYAAHAALPGAALKVPGTHAVQSAPPLPEKPAVHVQLLMLEAP